MPVEGIDDLARLARDLKAAGNKDLTKELRRGLQRSVKPLKEAGRQGALDELPTEGGLAAEIAASRFTGRVSLLGRNPRVTLEAKGRNNEQGKVHDLDAMDRGRLRHPTYGRKWVTQTITPGWWTSTMTAKSEGVQARMFEAADAVLKKLGRG